MIRKIQWKRWKKTFPGAIRAFLEISFSYSSQHQTQIIVSLTQQKLLGRCVVGQRILNYPNMNLSKILNDEMASTWQWRIDTDPELAASLGLLSRRRSNHALDPRSPSSFQDRWAWIQRALGRIQKISDEQWKSLGSEDYLSYQLYVGQLTDYLEYTKEHKTYLCCINRLEGPQTDLPLYAKYLPIQTFEQRKFYRDFLRAIPVQLAEVTDLLRLGLVEQRTPPKISLEGVVPQIRGMIAGNLTAFRGPIENAFCLPDEIQIFQECQQLLSDHVQVAWEEFATFLQVEYIPNLRDEISATKGYPNGEKYYQDCLKFHTTTDMTPQDIHQLGLDEVARIRQAMQDIAMSEGYERDQLQDYLDHLRTAKEFEPQNAASLLAHYRDITGRIYPALLNLFHVNTLPRSPLEITETPAAHASMAPAAYYLAGSLDSRQPRPGRFYVNTSELSTRRTYECEALALHEAIPGHHTQASIQAENPTLPDFRRYCEDRRYFEAPGRFPFYTGYIEGWGLHSETLGEELGLYQHPSDRMGQLSMEALRSCRLVVDTGMHALGWTMDQALTYMVTNTAMGQHDAFTEVARYVTWPGQATAYKVGELVFRALRHSADTASGWDKRDFYREVLTCGPVPLQVLEARVDECIRNRWFTARRDDETTFPSSTDSVSCDIIAEMTFANWCKCCVVPGTCA
jgi:uncharacterized protein (DUF885 family)